MVPIENIKDRLYRRSLILIHFVSSIKKQEFITFTDTMRIIFLLLFIFITTTIQAQWTDAELDEADTAAGIETLTDEEQDIIMYINLCRLFPKQFAELELSPYKVNEGFPDSYKKQFQKYKKTLLKDLTNRQPANALRFDSALHADSKCYATEISKADRKGHTRINCPQSNYAECISFGMVSGKDIAIQWLVDAGVSTLGHRKIVLDPSYTKTGVTITNHFKWPGCAVAEFF